MEQTVAWWLAHFGPLGLFVLQMLGIFGLPIPDETVMVLAGVMVSRGQLRLAPTAAAAVTGAMTGITVSFIVGRFGGLPLLLRYGSKIHISRSALARAERWFASVGKWLLVVGYFIPGVRHVTAIVAGASNLPARTFLVFAYVGAALWVGCFLSLGYLLADEWRGLLADFYRYARVFVLIGIALVAIYALWITRRRS